MICINQFQRTEIPGGQHGNNNNACSTQTGIRVMQMCDVENTGRAGDD